MGLIYGPNCWVENLSLMSFVVFVSFIRICAVWHCSCGRKRPKLSIECSNSTTGSNFGAVNLQSIKEQGHIFKDKTSWYSTQESTS